MDGLDDEQFSLCVIEELTQEMRRLEAGVPARHGVRALIKFVWSNLIDRKLIGRSREELVREVRGYGVIGNWFACDIAVVCEGIRAGRWDDVRALMAGPRCSMCRQREDVMRELELEREACCERG